MSNDDGGKLDKTDWRLVEQVSRRRAAADALPLRPPTSGEGGTGLQQPTGASVRPEGVIASLKANAITRRAAVAHLKMYYEHQLDAARHQLTEIVKVRKAESSAVAEQMLASINSQQMQFLIEVGLQNEQARHRALMQLNDQVSQTLRQVQAADWPDQLRDQAINGIIDRQIKFFDRLMTDLGE